MEEKRDTLQESQESGQFCPTCFTVSYPAEVTESIRKLNLPVLETNECESPEQEFDIDQNMNEMMKIYEEMQDKYFPNKNDSTEKEKNSLRPYHEYREWCRTLFGPSEETIEGPDK